MFLRSNKEISRLRSKRMSNIYFNSSYRTKLTFSKLRFSESKKFVYRSVFNELHLTQMSLNFKTFCCNLKIRDLGANAFVAFLLFFLKRNYDVLKSQSPFFFFFNKKENSKTKRNLKWKIPHSFTKANLVLQFKKES